MTHIIDRRQNPSGKSLPNRQKFKKRVGEHIRKEVRRQTQTGDIADIMKGGSVSIPIDGINEPTFHHSNGGIHDRVFPGNKKFSEGEILERGGGGKGKGGTEAGEGDSTDSFQFYLSRDEYIDYFLEDLELPDLAKRKLVDTESEGLKRAGYSVSGSPANMAVARTAKIALGRRTALGRPSKNKIEAQRERLRHVWEETEDEAMCVPDIIELERLERKAKRISYIDPIDVRYRRFEPQPKPNSQAVMFCLMDVSGSMSEHLKDLAKRFYILLYVFLEKRYEHVEIVFIRHTDHAEEVDEKTFFYDPASGGTLVSSALRKMHEIVKERFSPADWNIYLAQASDGDNAYSDDDAVTQLMRDAILPLCQFAAYLEVGESGGNVFNLGADTSLWKSYEKLRSDTVPFAMRKVKERSEIFPVFHELFKKRMPGEVL